jgi:hypothetical protein
MFARCCECYSELINRNQQRRETSFPVEFLLNLMRISHAILGITPAKPEDERGLLLLWIVSLGLILAFTVTVLLFLPPRIMR